MGGKGLFLICPSAGQGTMQAQQGVRPCLEGQRAGAGVLSITTAVLTGPNGAQA